MAIGDALINQPAEAAACFERAARYPLPSDIWGFDQQRAWQRLAALYERQKEYRKAVAALESWTVRSDCGNGREADEFRKKIWILRLRKEYEPKEEVEGEHKTKERIDAELWDWLRRKRMFLAAPDEVVRQNTSLLR